VAGEQCSVKSEGWSVPRVPWRRIKSSWPPRAFRERREAMNKDLRRSDSPSSTLLCIIRMGP